MTQEAAEAIRIADKHLAGESAEKRLALAMDISAAIMLYAGKIASDVIAEAFNKVRH